MKDVDLFSEVEPNQKERIIIALKKAGFVVGYMGDGINDVSALHAADIGISVDSAADLFIRFAGRYRGTVYPDCRARQAYLLPVGKNVGFLLNMEIK